MIKIAGSIIQLLRRWTYDYDQYSFGLVTNELLGPINKYISCNKFEI